MTKVIILAGGRGHRMGTTLPKPLTPICGRPIIEHVIRTFERQAFDNIVVALGHHAGQIRRVIADINISGSLTCVDTGLDVDTGGRLKRLQDHIPDGTSLLAWCDGLTDLAFDDLLAAHKRERRLATMTAVRPTLPFGLLQIEGTAVRAMQEKPLLDDSWINAGICAIERSVIDEVRGDECSWERDVVPKLIARNQLGAFRHRGFWKSMDNAKDAAELTELCAGGSPPWYRRQ